MEPGLSQIGLSIAISGVLLLASIGVGLLFAELFKDKDND